MHAENIIDTVKKSPLVKKYINGELTDKVYFINADGGYGKTTALKSLYYYLVNTVASGNHHIVPIFIDVKLLMDFGNNSKNEGLGNMPRPLEKYIVRNYCGQDIDPNETLLEKVINLFSNNSPKFNNEYTYCIFVDGINEVDDSTKRTILTEIKEMLECGCVKFFISSRIDEKELPDETIKCKLMPLAEENIRKFLDNSFGNKYGEKFDITKINSSLVGILRVPMYLSVFRKTYDYPDIYEQTTVRKADLLDSYVQKILKDNKQKKRKEYNPLIEFVIKYYLPALAFKAYKSNSSMQISDKEFRYLRKDTNYFDSLLVPDELIECCKSNNTAIKGICLNLGLVQFVNGCYTFTHQNWRDLFVAKHIINCMNAEKMDEFEGNIYLNKNIRQFVGELIREYDDTFKYSKNYDDENDNRKCECDFEKKDNLKTWSESPIEQYLQKHNLKSSNPISPIITRNLIKIMATSRNKKITVNYNYLDLESTHFYLYDLQGSTFTGAKIKKVNFIQEFRNSMVIKTLLSNDGKLLVLESKKPSYLSLFYITEEISNCNSRFINNLPINNIAFSSDSSTIAIFKNNTLSIFLNDTHTHYIYKTKFNTVLSVKLSLDGTKVALVTFDGIYFANLIEDRDLHLVSKGIGVSFSPDGDEMACLRSCGLNGEIKIISTNNYETISSIYFKNTSFSYRDKINYSKDGSKIIVINYEKIITVCDHNNAKYIKNYSEILFFTKICHSFDMNMFAVLEYDTIKVYDINSGELIGYSIKLNDIHIKAISFSTDSKKIIVAYNSSIMVCDYFNNRSKKMKFSIKSKEDIVSIYLLSENQQVITVNDNCGIMLYDLNKRVCNTFFTQKINSNIQNCDFRDTEYSDNDKDEFYRIIYSNGGLVKDEFKPKPIPFEYNDEN